MNIQTLQKMSSSQRLMGMLYGPPGTGKTCFAAASNLRTVIIDADRGISSIIPRKKSLGVAWENIVVLECWNDTNKMTEALNYVFTNSRNFDLIVIDTLTLMQHSFLHNKIKNRKSNKGTYDDYNETLYAFTDVILSMKQMPCHVLFTAHEECRKVDGKYGPLFAGQLSTTYAGHMDYIGRCRIISVPKAQNSPDLVQMRVIDFGPEDAQDFKDRSQAMRRYETDDIGILLPRMIANLS